MKMRASIAAIALLATVVPARAQNNALMGSAAVLANGLSTTIKIVKPQPGRLSYLYCYNPNTTVAYVQVFDTAGTVTLGTTVPKQSFGFPPANGLLIQADANMLAGIKAAVATTATGNTAPGTPLDCNFGIR